MATIKAKITPQNRLLVTNYSVGGTAGSIKVTDLFDVDNTGLANGALLIYNEPAQKWETKIDLDNENTVLEGGTF